MAMLSNIHCELSGNIIYSLRFRGPSQRGHIIALLPILDAKMQERKVTKHTRCMMILNTHHIVYTYIQNRCCLSVGFLPYARCDAAILQDAVSPTGTPMVAAGELGRASPRLQANYFLRIVRIEAAANIHVFLSEK
jgi:hypothetical protein